MVRVQGFARYRSIAAASAFRLPGYPQIVLAPQPVNSFVVDPPAVAGKVGMGSAVAVPDPLTARGAFELFDKSVVVAWACHVLEA